MTTLSEQDERIVTDDEERDPQDENHTEQPESNETDDAAALPTAKRWSRLLGYSVLPAVALVLALVAGYLKWSDGSADDIALARTESVRVAGEDAVALLSYRADSVDQDLVTASERLTGEFKDAYTELTKKVVIPGAKEKHITAKAKVTAAAPVSVTANHAVVLLFVDQTVTIGGGAPTDTQPVIRTTLEKVNGRWLVSHFDPE